MDVITEDELVAEIEAFLDRHAMAPSTFGALAKGEAQFLTKLKGGRSPSLRVARKVLAFMRRRDAAVHADADTTNVESASPGTSEQISAEVEA